MMNFSSDDISFSEMWGYDIITVEQAGFTMEQGKPMVPMKYIRLAMPNTMKVTTIELLEFKEHPLPGRYTLLPAQPILPISAPFEETMFTEPEAEIYSSTEPYPHTMIELIGQSDLAGQVMADIALYPIRYTPAEKTVTFVSSMTVRISGTDEYLCSHYLSPHLSEQSKEMYQQMVQGMVINPDQVVLRQPPHTHSSSVPPGTYDYVIITQDSWVSAFQPLSDWKTQKGIPANIVSTSWIYNSGGYSGTNLEKIQSFIKDAYNSWGTVYFLLGGDTNVIPTHYRTFSSVDPEPVPNDTYYAQFSSNTWVCNVHVGRASVTGPGTGTGQIGNFVNKILKYEKNPQLSNFAKKAGFFGFDLDSSTYTEQLKINIRNTYVPAGWTMTTVYDSHPGNHQTDVIAAINAGQNLMNHADHCNLNYMGTGYVNHYWGLTNTDMNSLTNTNQGIMYSLGCWPAAYDEPACIAEYFVRNSNGGGVAFIGNSRYGWYNPGTYNTLSMKYDAYFFKSLFPENHYKLGVCFSDHKNDAYQWDLGGYYKYIFTELTLLGDPEMPIWKENPISLTASFPTQLPLEPTSFTVTVTSGTSPVNQAYVCLWKGTEIYLTGFTNSAGQKTFSLTPTSPGKMHITVTKQNYLPYEGVAMIGNSPPNTPERPTGPPSGKTNVQYTYSTSAVDPNGDDVFYLWDWGDGTQSDWLGPYKSGDSISTTHQWTVEGSYSIKVKAKDTFGLESPWSDPLVVSMPYSYHHPILQVLQLLLERFPNAFPLLRHLVYY